MKMPSINTVVMALLIIGGINAGLSSVFDVHVVANVLGASSTASEVLYGLIGLAAVYTCAGMLGIISNEE